MYRIKGHLQLFPRLEPITDNSDTNLYSNMKIGS